MALGWRGNYLRYKEIFLDVVVAYQKKQSIKVFVELILTLTAITVFSVFALRPTAIAISGLLKEIEAKETLVSEMDTKIANIRQAQTVAQQQAGNLALLDSALPDSPQPDKLAAQLEGVLAASGVGISNLAISEVRLLGTDTRPRRAGPALEFSLTLTGQFASLKSFVATLEALRRPVNIVSVNLSQQSTTNLFAEIADGLNLSISATTPYLPLE